MNSHFLKDRVIFPQFNPFSCVFSVFGSDVPRDTSLTTRSMLSALQYYLYSITFLSHNNFTLCLRSRVSTFSFCFLNYCVNTFLADGLDYFRRHSQRYPTILFRYVEFLRLKIRIELTFRSIICVRYVVTYACFLT
jgi:hypothetical protein